MPIAAKTAQATSAAWKPEMNTFWSACWGLTLHAGGGAVPMAGTGDQADRAISTGQLRGLLPVHLRPIDVVVCHGSQRDLVLRRVSRLDAFSGYPVRT